MKKKTVAEQWTELAIAMIQELSMDYIPGEFKDTDGVKAIQTLRRKVEFYKREVKTLKDVIHGLHNDIGLAHEVAHERLKEIGMGTEKIAVENITIKNIHSFVGKPVKINWKDEACDWHYFKVLETDKYAVHLQGMDDPVQKFPHIGDKFWTYLAEIENIELA